MYRHTVTFTFDVNSPVFGLKKKQQQQSNRRFTISNCMYLRITKFGPKFLVAGRMGNSKSEQCEKWERREKPRRWRGRDVRTSSATQSSQSPFQRHVTQQCTRHINLGVSKSHQKPCRWTIYWWLDTSHTVVTWCQPGGSPLTLGLWGLCFTCLHHACP